MNIVIKYNGMNINLSNDKLVNLTDMWKAVDGKSSQRVPKWRELPSTKNFLESLEKDLNVRKSDLWKTRGGNGGGTYGHWQIALAYAKYLSPEFHIWANKALREHCEEAVDPGLKIDRGVEAYRRKGYSEEWIANRQLGKTARDEFTSILGECNAKWRHYAIASDMVNKVVLGMTEKAYRKQMGISHTRDGQSKAQLAMIRAIEALATERIDAKQNEEGWIPVEDALKIVGKTAKAFEGIMG